jgi:hypothetical protein
MNLAVITTIGINAGDNFIYEGFKNLFPAKHFHSVFLIDKRSIPRDNNYKKLIDLSDLIVICGSPIFYEQCYKMKWQNKLIEYCEKSGKRVLAFAVGSNFKCSPDGDVELPDISGDDKYREFASRYSKILFGDFIVRDRYSKRYLMDMGFRNVRQIVCPSLFSYPYGREVNERDLIFIIWGDNYWNCKLSPKKILKICKDIQEVLQMKFSDKRVIWVCHDFESYSRLLKHIDRRDILFSTNYMDFFKYYSQCYFAFSVKVHGSMLLASMGITSLLLQLDSRAAVIESLGENYAKPADPMDKLIDMCESKIKSMGEYRDSINTIRDKYKGDYINLFNNLGLI